MNDHWTDAEREALKSVSTFEEMAEIALSILARMKKVGQPIVQICGPMSTGGLGSLEMNMERFQVAVNKATEMGLTVFNQAPFQDAMVRLHLNSGGNGYCMEILDVFYHIIFESGYLNRVMFLPDWQTSKGSCWEREKATSIGIAIDEYPMEWLCS